jgi:hypothetical protein
MMKMNFFEKTIVSANIVTRRTKTKKSVKKNESVSSPKKKKKNPKIK